MTTYILQAILFQLLFLLVYEVLLKKETFFSYNRWYLLITTFLSLLLPLIKIETLSILVPAESFSRMSTIFLPEVFIGGGAAPESIEHLPAVMVESSVSGINPWLVIYLLGVLTALVIVLKKYSDLSRMFRFKKIASEGKISIIEVPNSSIACTFYRTIFLGDQLTEAEKQQILSHELVHVRQKHSLDLVFFEVLKVILWFNPLIYIYQKRIMTLHEFIADAAVVETTGKHSYYEQLLNSAFSTKNISFINQFFNHSLIKKRIVMLQKSRSKTISKARYFIVFPIILAMLTVVACSYETSPKVETSTEAGDQDAAMKAALWEEITAMQARGASFDEITDAFFIEKDAHIKSKEAYFRFQTLTRMFYENTVKREKAAGTYDENSLNPFQSVWDQDYDAYVASRKNKSVVEKRSPEQSDDKGVPFAVVDQVPVFPGCENFGSNEERKDCMTEKVTAYVSANFDTSLGKKLGLNGVNRVIVVFRISPEGNITDVRARAAHPDLEVEAKRVIEGLPQMAPGKNNGQNVGVLYSLPIVFQVN